MSIFHKIRCKNSFKKHSLAVESFDAAHWQSYFTWGHKWICTLLYVLLSCSLVQISAYYFEQFWFSWKLVSVRNSLLQIVNECIFLLIWIRFGSEDTHEMPLGNCEFREKSCCGIPNLLPVVREILPVCITFYFQFT